MDFIYKEMGFSELLDIIDDELTISVGLEGLASRN